MKASTEWQLGVGAAERYERILTPVILGPFAKALVEVANVGLGERVLDVGCGTGAAARYAAELVGDSGWVMGVDVNEGMIAVAATVTAETRTPIEWRVADAVQLPLEDGQVDVVLCAQSLQFMRDKQLVLAEMRRVLGRNGRAALSLWCGIEENPYFQALIEAVTRHVGADTAVGLRSIFALSNEDDIKTLVETAGFGQVEIQAVTLNLEMPPLSEFIPLHISATPMAAGFQQAGQAVQKAVVQEVIERVRPYSRNGAGRIPFRSYMVMLRD